MNMKNLSKLSAMLLEENAGKYAPSGNTAAREAGKKAEKEAEEILKEETKTEPSTPEHEPEMLEEHETVSDEIKEEN